MASFDLRYEPWIPCHPCDDEEIVLLSLRDALVRAHEMREIVDASPLVEASLMRFLLAILHKAFGPEDTDAWGKLWANGEGKFDSVRIEEVIGHWNGLDLFSETHPFYQSASLSAGEKEPAVLLDHARWTYNNALFTHVYKSTTTPLSPAEAARFLIAFQAFDMPGFTKGSGKEKSALAAPLQPAAIITSRGETLFQTLMLNLHQYNPSFDIPFNSRHDKLAWEREEETQALERHPDGYLDWLTWQSRRVRVYSASETDGGSAVSEAFYVKGYQPKPQFWPSRNDSMIAFHPKTNEELKKESKKAPGGDSAKPIRFRLERGLWRDSMALLQHSAGERRRPRIFDWLADLVADGLLDERYPLSISVFGMCSDKAKVLYWRHEQLPLPLGYLRDSSLLERLRAALRLSEDVGCALDRAAFAFAEHAFPEVAETKKPSDREREINKRKQVFAPGRRYWPALDNAFTRYLVDQANEHIGAPADEPVPNGTTFLGWVGEVEAAAEIDLRTMLDSLADTPRVIRAREIADAVYRTGEAMARTHAGLSERRQRT